MIVVGLGELTVRLGIRAGIGSLRNPALYTHPFCNDDYHKLRFLWSRDKDLRPGAYVQDPLLGWVPDRQVTGSRIVAASQTGGPLVGLFGDSFTSGVPPASADERIGALLSESIPGGSVVDLSVAGYGVDQIYLRFEQALKGAYGPVPDEVVVGILLDDIDRVVERFRAGPKPYFVVEGDALDLRGVPIQVSPEESLKQDPVRIRSYLKALLQTGYFNWREWRGSQRTAFESECRRPEKEAINSRLLQRIDSEASAVGIEPVFVVFYGERSLQVESWREAFLLSTLQKLDAQVLDTKPLLLSAAAASNTSISDLFYPAPNGHLNPRGNTLIADAVYQLLRPRYGWPEQIRRAWKMTVDLGRTGNHAVPYKARGWAQDGDTFSWTVEPRAFLEFEADLPPDRDLILQLETVCALKVPGDERKLVVRVAGVQVAEFPMLEFPDCWAHYWLEAPISRGLVAGGDLSIELEMPSLLTPREAGFDLADERRLGLALASVSLREAR